MGAVGRWRRPHPTAPPAPRGPTAPPYVVQSCIEPPDRCIEHVLKSDNFIIDDSDMVASENSDTRCSSTQVENHGHDFPRQRQRGWWARLGNIENTCKNTPTIMQGRGADKTSGRKYNMGPKQKVPAEAKAENTSGPHYESPHGGDRGRPKSCGPLVFSALASACIFCFGPMAYFMLWPHIIL